LNNTTEEQVGGLYFDGVPQAYGTWGSTSSAAANTNDNWFKGSGILNVVEPPAAPEITVELLGAQLLDGPSNVRFGESGIGMPVVNTFTITAR
jgi:hypothetical protein